MTEESAARRGKTERSAEEARLAGRDEEALSLFEEVLDDDLRAGQVARAVSIYQKIVLWKPELRDLHRRLAQRIGDARESTSPARPAAAPSPGAVPETPLFQGIPAEQIPEILQSMRPGKFDAGAEIVREGEPGDSLFLITEGSASVRTRDESGRAVPLATLGVGDFFGEVSLITSRPRTATVRAETPVGVLELTRERLGPLRSRFPGVDQALTDFHRLRAEKTVEALLAQRRPPS